MTSFVWLAGSVAGARLSLGECIAGAIAVGTIGGSWAVYFAACLTGSLTPFSVTLGTGLMVGAAAMTGRRAMREIERMVSTGFVVQTVSSSSSSSSNAANTSDASRRRLGGNGDGSGTGGKRGSGGFDGFVTYIMGIGRSIPLRNPDYVLIVLELILGLWLWPLYSSRMIPEQHGNIFSGGSCYGDLPIHMQIAK